MNTEMFDDVRLTAMGLFVEVSEGLATKLSAVVAEEELFGVDFDALIRLARSPGQRLRMIDLAAQTSLSTSGVTRVVDRLEHQGLVQRQASPTDRRASFAALTDHGRERLSSIVPRVVETIDRWFTGRLTAEQLDDLLATLHVIRDAVRPGALAGVE